MLILNFILLLISYYMIYNIIKRLKEVVEYQGTISININDLKYNYENLTSQSLITDLQLIDVEFLKDDDLEVIKARGADYTIRGGKVINFILPNGNIIYKGGI